MPRRRPPPPPAREQGAREPPTRAAQRGTRATSGLAPSRGEQEPSAQQEGASACGMQPCGEMGPNGEKGPRGKIEPGKGRELRAAKKLSEPPGLAELMMLWGFAAAYRIPVAWNAVTDAIHPDSVHQSVEMAHLWAYGSGHRPLEFALPEPAGPTAWDFFMGPDAQQADALRSQYAMRSPLLPGIFYAAFRAFALLFPRADYHDVVLPCSMALYALWTSVAAPAACLFVHAAARGSDAARPASLVAGAAVAAHHVLLMLGGNALLNSFLSPLVFLALTVFLRSEAKRKWEVAAAGAALGVVVYARCDQLLFCAACGLAFPGRVLRGATSGAAVLGGLTAVAMMAAMDAKVYGWPLASPLRWFIFNVVLRHSTKFGVEPSSFYVAALAADQELLSLAAASFVALSAYCTRDIGGRNPNHATHLLATSAKLASAAAIAIGSYSMLGHKEIRFIHDPLVLLLAALGSAVATAPLPMRAPTPRLGLALALISLAFCKAALPATPTHWFTSHPPWATHERWERHRDVNRALAIAGRATDLRGLLLMLPNHAAQFPLSCGWSCLHKPAPIAVVGFHGAQLGLRLQIWPSTINTEICLTATLPLDAASDWGLRSEPFNYVVADSTLLHAQSLATLGFKTVAQHGSAIVARRTVAGMGLYELWKQAVHGWNCAQYFRLAPPAEPIAASTWVRIEGAEGFGVKRDDSSGEVSASVCERHGKAFDRNCLHAVHDWIAQATVRVLAKRGWEG